jgi:acetylornithine deacetylase
MHAEIEPSMRGVEHPYNINIGMVEAGDWRSSVPATARLGLRIGHPTSWSTDDAMSRVRAAIDAIDDPWLHAHPPTLRPMGFRAKGYAMPGNDPLARRLTRAHRSAHGNEPAEVAMASTTDARLYLNDFDVPALCYGPVAHDIHGVDESVDLSSIVAGARSLARFIEEWYAEDPV